MTDDDNHGFDGLGLLACVTDDDNHGFDGLGLLAYLAAVGDHPGVRVVSPCCLLWHALPI